MRTSKDYDDMIERYEQQLKDWKAKRRELRTAEARRAKAKAEEQRQKDLLQYGREVESYRGWMRMTVIFHDDGTRRAKAKRVSVLSGTCPMIGIPMITP